MRADEARSSSGKKDALGDESKMKNCCCWSHRHRHRHRTQYEDEGT
jgi:hypothetical protein